MPINSFSSLSDTELVSLALDDNQEAFACLLGRYNAMIHSKAVAKSRLCHCDMTDDMAQEAAIGFLNAVRSYDPKKGTSFRTYSERCVENVLTTAVRSYLSGKNMPLNDYEQLDDSDIDGRYAADDILGDIEGYVLSGETRRQIWDVIFSELTDLERSVIEHRLLGLSYEETAKALGISDKSVDNAIQRIRQKFKSLMRK